MTPETVKEITEGGLSIRDLFVGMRVRYENMDGTVEANPDYNPYANMEDYASGRLPAKCIYKWIVRCGTDGFYPESVLAHGGKLSPTNDQAHTQKGRERGPDSTQD